MKEVIIKPGTILLWKDYNWLQRLCAKVRKKKLENNTLGIATEQFSIYFADDIELEFNIYEPKKQYSKQEAEKLRSSILDMFRNDIKFIYRVVALDVKDANFADYLNIINTIRPNTIDVSLTVGQFTCNKYYKKVNAEKC